MRLGVSTFDDVTTINIHVVSIAWSSTFDDIFREYIFKTEITNKLYEKMLNFVPTLISLSPVLRSGCENFFESDPYLW